MSRIPTIDFSTWRHGDAGARVAFARELATAAADGGFFLLARHGIRAATIDRAFAAGHRFFALPDLDKRRLQDRERSDRGYQPMFDNVREDGKPSGQEGYTMSHPVAPSDPALARLLFYAPTPWPGLPGFREDLEALYHALFDVGHELLAALALDLGASMRVIDAALVDTYSHLRINHYPPHEAVAHVAEEGVFAHVDESLLTLLVQDANGGLDVMDRDGDWIAVEPDASAIVVNVGRMLAHWTGGRYNAALHRVINRSGRDRYSIPLFLHPRFDAVIDPAALIGGTHRDHPPVVAGEQVHKAFLASRVSWKEALDGESTRADRTVEP